MTKDNSTSNSNNPVLIDAKGLKCPMPVIKLQQQVRKSEPGTHIKIACTDSGAEKDIASWCRVNKHELSNVEITDYGWDLEIEVKGR